MRPLAFLVPGRLDTATGGFRYDRRMAQGLRDLGWDVTAHELDDGFPQPSWAAVDRAVKILASIPDEGMVVIDGLALGAMPAAAAREAERLWLVGLVHHPLCAESGLSPEHAAALAASERRALEAVRLVVVTSRRTSDAVAQRFGVPAERIAVVEPGTDPAPLARGSGDSRLELICVANIVPRKGHEILLAALASMRTNSWRLTCAGSLDRDPDLVRRLRAFVHEHDLDDRVRFVGELDEVEVAACYQSADAFVLPTLYEGYGMAVAEAIARGLPVISTPVGAIADLIGHEAGILVPPGDPFALAAALVVVIGDEGYRARLRAGAQVARQRLRTWPQAAARLADVLTPGADGVRFQR